MYILIAPDKFRGSLEASEVCQSVAEGIRLAYPDAEIISVPLADGGEGTMRILTEQSKGKFVTTVVHDPLGRYIEAEYGLSGDGNTAFIEMAAASGLNLLKPEERNPLLTNTYGTGELILYAINSGVKKIILGIGGSATTEAGIGMASALGYKFLDENEKEVMANGENISSIKFIKTENVNPLLKSVEFIVACDVTNPLYGKSGAAYIYGPQKGADKSMVFQLDNGLKNIAKVASETFGEDISDNPGAGAAGGLGAGALWFLNAELREGVSIVMEQTNIAEHIQKADLVITGEGKVDEQTLQGKVVKGLADLCQKNNVPLAVVCGTLMISPEETQKAGITYAVSVLNRPMNLQQAETEAFSLVRDATFHLVRLFFNKSRN
ncbi:glycerate kinase [Dyadobacter frigoris]|uniref:Glycerate kinase n=1 Tax=Dyadobacter frigoris TaxID=2576211 RepID=A0A4U6D542_9BACT|nr:glycerate kinase [Dyadobacter frigoris]TKT91535.1 glycerate kinase [Dyadobacter frigoris]GLU51907.1 glycerate 2-kinase [Dyadobacter frigoris]